MLDTHSLVYSAELYYPFELIWRLFSTSLLYRRNTVWDFSQHEWSHVKWWTTTSDQFPRTNDSKQKKCISKMGFKEVVVRDMLYIPADASFQIRQTKNHLSIDCRGWHVSSETVFPAISSRLHGTIGRTLIFHSAEDIPIHHNRFRSLYRSVLSSKSLQSLYILQVLWMRSPNFWCHDCCILKVE